MADDVRKFNTGATRDKSTTKFDIDGFLSPFALHRFFAYMHKHRYQSDGTLRDSDNWQKGIPIAEYRKSLHRHFFDVWCLLRAEETGCAEIARCCGQATDQKAEDIDLEDSICGMMFNLQGLLHEIVKSRLAHGDKNGRGANNMGLAQNNMGVEAGEFER